MHRRVEVLAVEAALASQDVSLDVDAVSATSPLVFEVLKLRSFFLLTSLFISDLLAKGLVEIFLLLFALLAQNCEFVATCKDTTT